MCDPTTIRVVLDPATPDPRLIAHAGQVLRDAHLVAYPTDTMYGLGIDPRLPEAVDRLFHAKGRPDTAAVPFISADIEQVESYLGPLTPLGRRLAERFWPGPLTLVIDAAPTVNRRLLGGRDSVAVRVPNHVVARAVATELGHPVTSTSANATGAPAASCAADVVAALGLSVALVIDAGPSGCTVPSTIIDARGDAPVLLRDGVVAWDRVVQSLA